MKQVLFCLLLISATLSNASAQWTQQTAPVKNNLRDVAFCNASIGYAVGDGGTILKTKDGGKKWITVTAPDKSNIVSVTVLDTAALMVTTSSENGNAAIYESINGGITWSKVLTDLSPFYATIAPGNTLYSVSSQIYSSRNWGRSWWAQRKLNGTSAYHQITFSDKNTGIAAGNISGAFTYSADFLRTVDGENWYNGYNLAFPNANGFSSFSSVGTDTVMMFTNFYNRFSPGDSSQLVLLNHFALRNLLGTDYWFFNKKILINSFPDRINDCQFFSGGNGYAVSEKGTIYKILNLGKNITREWSSKTPLRAVYMLDKNNGFAVGDNGMILKREPINTANPIATIIPVRLYPNPAADGVQVSFALAETTNLRLQITNENGNIVLTQPAKSFEKGNELISLKVNHLPRGNYRVSLITNRQETMGTAQMMVVH